MPWPAAGARGGAPFLDAAEEAELFGAIEAGAAAAADLDTADAARAQEARALVERAEVARRRVVEAHQRLVVGLAVGRRGRERGGGAVDDVVRLVEEGNRGLLEAVGAFDRRRGHRFSTVAVWWVQAAMGTAAVPGAEGET